MKEKKKDKKWVQQQANYEQKSTQVIAAAVENSK